MTGPIFRYDGRLAGTDQIPPHFSRTWFTSDFNDSWIHAVKLDEQGKMVGEAVDIFAGLSVKLKKPLDFQQGPDGARYFLSYSCGGWRTADDCMGIYRIAYKGTCKNPSLVPEAPVTAGRALPFSLVRALDYDVRAEVFVGSGAGRIFRSRQPSLYQVRLVTTEGVSTWVYPHVNASGR